MHGLPRLTIEEKILLVLVEHISYRDEFQVPPALTQEGLSDLIGVSRPNITRSLKALSMKGLVEERLSHVQGHRRRKKVYMIPISKLETVLKLRGDLERTALTIEGVDRTLGDMATELDLTPLATYLHVQGTGRSVRAVPKQVERPLRKRETPFFGRARELSQLKRWMGDRTSDLAIVHGMGGIGKTALLESFCSTIKERRCVWYRFTNGCTLQGTLNSLEGLLAAPGLGSSNGARDAAFELGRAISDKVLLVLDDLHMAPAELLEVLSNLLALDVPSVKVLAASRTKLAFYSARDTRVRKNVLELHLEGLSEGDSMDLLVHRGFDEASSGLLYERCKGYPIALMLAPVRRVREGEELGQDAESFIMNEIVAKLSADELSVVRLLSTLRVPVSKAHMLVKGVSMDPASLDELTSRSIVTRGPSGYEVHPVVSDLVRSRTPKDLQVSLHSAVADHYTSEDPSAMGVIEASYHLLKAGRARDLSALLRRKGLFALEEGFMELLMVLGKVDPLALPIADVAWYYLLLGAGESSIGEHARAVNDLTRALDAASRSGEADASFTLALGTTMGRALIGQGKLDEAGDWFDRASAAFKELRAPDDQDMVNGIWAKNGLGLSRKGSGDMEGALSAFEAALSLARDYDPGNMVSSIYGNIASVHMETGDLDKALSALKSGLKVSERLRDRTTSARLHEMLGDLHSRSGEQERAKHHYERAMESSSSSEVLRRVFEGYLAHAGTVTRSQPTMGQRLVSFLLGKSDEEQRDLARVYNRICRIEKERGHMPSVEVHNKAVLLFKEAGMDRMLGKSLNNLGYARSQAGDTEGALQAYKDALVALRKVRDERGEAITGFNLGNLLAETGDHKRALELLTNSLALMRKVGMDNEAKEASQVLRSIKGPARR